MDIRVGSPPPVGSPGQKATGPAGTVEARVLAVRQPRRRGDPPPTGTGERRGAATGRDPATARVLVLLIQDGSKLPPQLESGDYRVFLRFARR